MRNNVNGNKDNKYDGYEILIFAIYKKKLFALLIN